MGLTHSSTPTPQELVLEPAQRRARLEGLRYAAALKQQAAQHSTALLHWGALWRQLSSPCGAWALRWAGRGSGRDLDSETAFGVRPGRHRDFYRLLCPPMTTIRDVSAGTHRFPAGSCPVPRHTRACV